jgi:integrase
MASDKHDPRDHHIWRSPGGALYFKLAVPAEVRGRLPPTETGRVRDRITEPLGTDSFTQARILRDQKLARWQQTFARLARGAVLTPEEMASERQRIRRNSLQTLLATTPLTPSEASGLNALWVKSIQAAQPGLLAEMKAEVRAIADEKYGAGVITEDSETWKEIWPLVARSKAKAFEDRLVVLLRSQSQFSEFPSDTMEQPAPILPTNNGNGNLERFSVALEHYLAWLQNEQKVRPATVAGYRSKAECFIKFAADPSLGAVDIDQAKAFLKHVAETQGVGDATINTYHFVCRKVYEYTQTERHRFHGDNPFSFKRRKAEEKSKSKFSIEELNKLFGSPTFTAREIKPKTYGVTSALPWAALVALYSGAGLEEIVQLRRRDIRQEAGVWVIDVLPEAALSGALKRPARRRIIPLHPELERLGLLTYLNALPRGVERLFPGLPAPTNGKDKLGAAVGKSFNRWRKKLGIDYEDRQLDFHSLRHVFIKALENAGTSQSDAARLAGHKVKGITFGLYSGRELQRLAGIVERIKYDGLQIDR